jgi:hypothetical protein
MQIDEVKKNLNRKVTFRGGEYILTGCIIRKDKKTNQFYYQAELQDTSTQLSLVYARLEEVNNDRDT